MGAERAGGGWGARARRAAIPAAQPRGVAGPAKPLRGGGGTGHPRGRHAGRAGTLEARRARLKNDADASVKAAQSGDGEALRAPGGSGTACVSLAVVLT